MAVDRPKRVHIIGGAGSGKSYLARKLGAALNLPVCNLDDLFWANDEETYGIRAKPGERDGKLEEFVAQDGWVVEGAYHGWVEASFERADIILVLRPGPWLRDARILKRFVSRRLGIEKTSKKETISGLVALLRWNHGYDGDNLARALKQLQAHEGKVHTFRKADQAVACVLGEIE